VDEVASLALTSFVAPEPPDGSVWLPGSHDGAGAFVEDESVGASDPD